MTDKFQSYGTGLDSPARGAFAIVPGSAELADATRAIYVGGGGDVVATTVGGGTVTFVGVPAGSILPIRASHVLSASTATNMVGLI